MRLIDGVDGAKEFSDGDFADTGQDVATNAGETDFVALVNKEAKDCHDVFDFLTVVEADAADDFIGDMHVKKSFFKSIGLGIGAVKDGEVGKIGVVFLKIEDFHGDVGGFGGFILEVFDVDGLASFGVGEEGFVGASFVFVNDFLRGGEDILGGAVVLFEFDDFGAREILFEVEDVGEVGAAPGVDGLPVVADDANVTICVDEEFDDMVLDEVGVLVLVDKNVVEFLLPFGADIGVVLE